MNVNERLKAIRKELQMTQAELAQVLGIASTTYAMIETGKRVLQPRYIKMLKLQYNVNEDWLLNGEGEPFYISPSKSRLVEQFDKMSPRIQQYYLQLSEELIKLDKDIT